MNNPPPVGGELETGAQGSPSISDVKLEGNVLPPNKGKDKAVITLPWKGQNMTHSSILGQCIVYKDEMKVLIAHNHTQNINIQQQGQTMRTS